MFIGGSVKKPKNQPRKQKQQQKAQQPQKPCVSVVSAEAHQQGCGVWEQWQPDNWRCGTAALAVPGARLL